MRVFISLGSNIQPRRNLPKAISILRKKFPVKNVSGLYETKPVGPAGQRKFWNAAVEVETKGPKNLLRRQLSRLEYTLGRRRNPGNKYAPRPIDLDLIPQKGYQKQAFIMVPLAEIAPRVIDRKTGKSFAALAGKMNWKVHGIRKHAA